jgi:hypothetical protein
MVTLRLFLSKRWQSDHFVLEGFGDSFQNKFEFYNSLVARAKFMSPFGDFLPPKKSLI